MQGIEKIEKLFKMLGSESDGECLNAVRLIKKQLAANNKNFSDLSNYLFNGQKSSRQQSSSQQSNQQQSHQRQRTRQESNSQYTADTSKFSRRDCLRMAEFLMAEKELNEWESEFTVSIWARLKSGAALTEKQLVYLVKTYHQHKGK